MGRSDGAGSRKPDLLCQARSNAIPLVRGHWSIENSVHWVLDVVFGDDDQRLRSNYGPRNMALVQRIALNLIRRRPSGRVMQFCHGDLSLPCRAGVPATYGNGSVEVRSVIDGGRPDAVWFAACRA